MKKISNRLIIIALLVMASFASYTYLVHESCHSEETAPLHALPSIEENTEQEEKIFLPDVELIKKMAKMAKKLAAAHS